MICLFTSEIPFFSLNGALIRPPARKKGWLWEKFGVLNFQESFKWNSLENSIILPITFLELSKRVFSFGMPSRRKFALFYSFLKWNEVVGGFLFKSHSGKWILEWVLVLENKIVFSYAFSIAVSLLQKGQLSSLSYPPVF